MTLDFNELISKPVLYSGYTKTPTVAKPKVHQMVREQYHVLL